MALLKTAPIVPYAPPPPISFHTEKKYTEERKVAILPVLARGDGEQLIGMGFINILFHLLYHQNR
jgi:hypothetical protein